MLTLWVLLIEQDFGLNIRKRVTHLNVSLYSIEIKEAKDKKERDDKVAQDCTFKPQINNNYGVVKRKTNR